MRITAIKIYKIFFIILLAIIIIPSVIYVINDHNEKLIIVMDKKVVEAALKCKYEKKCEEDSVTLKNLYELNYLEKVYDPISKELINENSYVDYNTNEFKIVK